MINEERVIYLSGEITDDIAAETVQKLLMLDAESDAEITMYLSSPGGSLAAAVTIIDTIELLHSRVNTVALGMCASAAAIILAVGTGKRYITKHSFVMLHQPRIITSDFDGKATDIDVISKHLNDNQKMICEILSEATQQPVEKIEKDICSDYFLNAEEAVNYHIVDVIIGKERKENKHE